MFHGLVIFFFLSPGNRPLDGSLSTNKFDVSSTDLSLPSPGNRSFDGKREERQSAAARSDAEPGGHAGVDPLLPHCAHLYALVLALVQSVIDWVGNGWFIGRMMIALLVKSSWHPYMLVTATIDSLKSDLE